MKRLFLIVALFFLPSVARAQNTFVTATVLDPASRPYTFATGYAALVCPGNQQPTYNGFTVPRTFSITGFDGTGTFTQTVYDVSVIQPVGCGYQWHITWQDGITTFITGTITTVTGSSVNESTAISAFAVLLPTSGGGGGTPGPPLNCFQYNKNNGFAGAPGICTPDGNSLNIKGPIPWVDATTYGVRALTNPFNTITVTTTGSSATVNTTGVSDFQVNDGIVIPAAGAATAQSTPSAPTILPVGAVNSSSISYECVGVDAHWGLTAASAAGTTSTAPTVFGWPAVGISSISRSSNVVTVNAASAFLVSSGTFHAVIAVVTGGSTQFSGLQLVTVTSATTLTYSQTGANESGTVGSTSYVLFENAFIVTQVQATAGSNQIVLTTDVNHNLQAGGARPAKIFLDGINFSAATPPGYANGLFAISSVTANTITVVTPYTSPITTTATALNTFATSQISQMTVMVWPLIDVSCPAISGTTKYYAVYANYGAGYAPIGFTWWLTNIFEDYGPAFTKTGFVPPVAMGLPATSPGAARNQVFTGQIQVISGSTLTLTATVPTAVTSATASHDNGVAFLNALASSCSNGTGGGVNNQGFASVYLPRQALGGTTLWAYLFSAPLDVSTNCNRLNVVDGGALWLDGTIYADNNGEFDWKSSHDLSGWTASANDGGGQVSIYGHASPMMVPGVQSARITGMAFNTLSNGQTGLNYIGSNATFKDDSFNTVAVPNLTSVPFVINNAQFISRLENTNWTGDRNFQFPIQESAPNGDLGQTSYWPVPVIDLIGPFFSSLIMNGLNYGVSRAVQIDNLYGNIHQPPDLIFSDVQTFQDPFQPFLTIYGSSGSIINRVDMTRIQMDSVQQPDIACLATNACIYLYTADAALTQNDGNDPSFTGNPSRSSFEFLSHGSAPAQNTNETYVDSNAINGSLGFHIAPITVSTLPSAAVNAGQSRPVLDSTTIAAEGQTCVGGGTVFAQAISNGTNWKCF